MVAKIGRNSNLYGTLSYNNIKIEKENGEILLMNKMIETADGSYSVPQLVKSFEPYLLANRNTEKHTLHISLNPDPKDEVTDEKYKEMAQHYMTEMGFANQPFIVFKHTDIDRSHIHIVSVCIDEKGKKISDKYEKIRSMKICRKLEKKFKLVSATEKQGQQNHKIFQSVDYKKGNIKSQIASIIRHLPSYYQFQSLGEYNALLSLFNITAEKIEGELQGQLKRGLLYFPLDSQGEKAGNPFKASLFGKSAGLPALELHFAKSKDAFKDHSAKSAIKIAVTTALKLTIDEQAFKKNLKKKGIDTVVRKNESGCIYGITFIDHHSKTVWNGSGLGKEYSANVFQNYWSKEDGQKSEDSVLPTPKTSLNNNQDRITTNPHPLFDVSKYDEYNALNFLGGILPLSLGEDQEETEFAYQMKRRKKRYRRK